MERFVLIGDVAYDVDADRSAAHQALLDAGERAARVYIGDPECPDHYASEYVLSDGGSLHMRTGR